MEKSSKKLIRSVSNLIYDNFYFHLTREKKIEKKVVLFPNYILYLIISLETGMKFIKNYTCFLTL